MIPPILRNIYKYNSTNFSFQDIFDAVESAVQDADGEVQMESPLGSHDELWSEDCSYLNKIQNFQLIALCKTLHKENNI